MKLKFKSRESSPAAGAAAAGRGGSKAGGKAGGSGGRMRLKQTAQVQQEQVRRGAGVQVMECTACVLSRPVICVLHTVQPSDMTRICRSKRQGWLSACLALSDLCLLPPAQG
jgi:hypothetical protein